MKNKYREVEVIGWILNGLDYSLSDVDSDEDKKNRDKYSCMYSYKLKVGNNKYTVLSFKLPNGWLSRFDDQLEILLFEKDKDYTEVKKLFNLCEKPSLDTFVVVVPDWKY